MELKKLGAELNKKLELKPPIPLDNDKGIVSELAEVTPELQAEDFGAGKIGREAARELLKRDLVPDSAYMAACKVAGRKPTKKIEEKPVAKKKTSEKKKVELPPETKPEKKTKTKSEPKEKAPRQKRESNEELATRLISEGKELKDLIEELRDRYAEKGKTMSETWLNKRASIYWNIGLKAYVQ